MRVVPLGPGANGGRHRREVLLAVLEDVTLVARLGEIGPPTALVAARHLGLQHGLVRHPARVEGDEPRAAQRGPRASASAFFTTMRTRSRWCPSTHSVFR